MQTFLIILTVLVSVLLIIVVLIQKSKGGGLASNLSGTNSLMGVRRTNSFIEKATWTLAIVILFLSIISSLVTDSYTSNVKISTPQQNVPTDMTAPAANADAAPAANAEGAGDTK